MPTLGLADGDRAAVVVSKRAQLGRWLPLLAAAISRLDASARPPGTNAAGGQAASGGNRRRLRRCARAPPRPSRLAPPALDLPTLLAACDLVVTVNSTVAIDAMALGIPALSVGVPNNLTPFVVAGGIAGVYHPSELQPALARCCGTRRRGRIWSRGAWRAPNPAGCGPTAEPPAGRRTRWSPLAEAGPARTPTVQSSRPSPL